MYIDGKHKYDKLKYKDEVETYLSAKVYFYTLKTMVKL